MDTPVNLFERLRRLGDATRAAEASLTDTREARDAAIEEAEQQGLSIREIARATGMSTARTQVVILRRTAARQATLAKHAGL